MVFPRFFSYTREGVSAGLGMKTAAPFGDGSRRAKSPSQGFAEVDKANICEGR
jgi:hypothetical protein